MCAMHTNTYLVVGGSTRPMRRSPVIANWVATLGCEVSGASFRAIDLLDLELHLDDEHGIPAMGGYIHETTRRWSELVSSAEGVVFVTPQYNWGYPAPLKNAIDRLYREWRDKPALIVTYGSQGGGKCAVQLREVLGGMGLRLTSAMPGLRLARERIEANDAEVDPDRDFDSQREELKDALRELVALSSPQPPAA
jgi:NAD(P)H-dependent FMN reductase